MISQSKVLGNKMLNDITNKNFRAIPNKSVEDMPNKKLLYFKQKLRNIPSKCLAILKKNYILNESFEIFITLEIFQTKVRSQT